MEVRLGYGDETVRLTIADDNVKIVSPSSEDGKSVSSLDDILEQAHPKLSDITRGKSVCILAEDCTRDLPHKEIAKYLCNRLEDAKKVTTIIATGTHDPNEEGNQRIKGYYKSFLAGLESDVLVHDCFKSNFKNLGRTSNGTKIIVNEKVLDHEVYISFSSMKPHYFAGYSNPYKNIVPGVCAFETIQANHSLTFDDRSRSCAHPLHPDQGRRDNPLAADILEGCGFVLKDRPAYALTFLYSASQIFWAAFGKIKEVTREGIAQVDKMASVKVRPADYAIISPGGFPNDGSLYIAQRALELTKKAVRDGGEILFLAECRNGVAHNKEAEEYFHQALKEPVDEILAHTGRYRLYAHKPYRFAQLLKRLSKIHVLSNLDDKTLEDIHLSPVKNAQEVVDSWLKIKPDARVLVFANANSLAVA